MTDRHVWVFTQAFSRLWEAAGQRVPRAAELLPAVDSSPEQKLLQLRALEEEGVTALTLFDVGRLPEGEEWRYVADVVSKSGSNPLRGLGDLLREPFIDVSNLYHVPEGHKGITAAALGARFEHLPEVIPACGDLHHLAIIAHTEQLDVTAVIVVAQAVASLKPEEFLAG